MFDIDVSVSNLTPGLGCCSEVRLTTTVMNSYEKRQNGGKKR